MEWSYQQMMGALIGLIRAADTEEKTPELDQMVVDALSAMSAGLSKQKAEEWTEKIRAQKFIISPGCASCSCPCGRTSDYDFALLEQEEPQIQELKRRLVKILPSAGAYFLHHPQKTREQLDLLYLCIFAVGDYFSDIKLGEMISELKALCHLTDQN